MAYSKLHSSIVNSSLWCEADHVRLLFITLLAMCDKDGCVYGSRIGIERAAMIEVDAGDENPWDVLMSPDSDSSDKMRAPENEGRRIEEISGGFRLLNFEYYRGLRNDDDRRDQNRRAQERFRRKDNISHGKPSSATVSPRKPAKAQAEAHSEAEAESSVAPSARRKTAATDPIGFADFWKAYPRRVARPAAVKAFAKVPEAEHPAIMAAIAAQRRSPTQLGNDPQFIPHPASWLNAERWKDDVASPTPQVLKTSEGRPIRIIGPDYEPAD